MEKLYKIKRLFLQFTKRLILFVEQMISDGFDVYFLKLSIGKHFLICVLSSLTYFAYVNRLFLRTLFR